ncbi:ribonuclease T [Mesobaculum littorinae]|uniref:Ribonuclease T n=1 Tax=Mesobaculum littorinae TaxID=2486419 RepID=A0A438AFU2_9RHOB|nr:ribonuclease T2 [Mesobaculum littorinae]RVV97475.1 ribonuclease T [Mesobaculum littorinae]
MQRFLVTLLCGLAFLPAPILAEGERAGAFDYWVLALSWSPNWCATEGAARGSEQCDPEAARGWVLHGLWPQYEAGWPSYCSGAAQDPSRAETGQRADLFGDADAAWYQWKKHGRCSGMAPGAYYDTARAAFDAVIKPDVFARMTDPLRMPTAVVEEAFLEANAGLSADMITITCKGDRIREARVCLSRDGLDPRICGADVIRDCTAQDALMAPIP